MKTKSILLTILCFALIVLCACNGKKKSHDGQDMPVSEMKAETSAKKYPLEKGVIYQKTEAMGIISEPVIYFDKWGEWEVTETTTTIEMMGMSNTSVTREITKGDDYWKIDMDEKTGTHYKRPAIVNPLGIDPEKASVEILGKMKLEKLGEETFLGYKCKKYRMKTDKGMEMEYLMYGNLMMKMKGEAMGMPIATEVIKIEPITPPADKFEVPADVEIMEY